MYGAGKFVTEGAAPSVMEHSLFPGQILTSVHGIASLEKAEVYSVLNLLGLGGFLLNTTYMRFRDGCFCSSVFNRFLQRRTRFL